MRYELFTSTETSIFTMIADVEDVLYGRIRFISTWYVHVHVKNVRE
jgi:hypothetical protein